MGVGKCMSYYNVDSFEKICKSNNTTKITTTNDNDNDDTNYDRQHDEPRSRRPCGPPKDPSCGLPKQAAGVTPSGASVPAPGLISRDESAHSGVLLGS